MYSGSMWLVSCIMSFDLIGFSSSTSLFSTSPISQGSVNLKAGLQKILSGSSVHSEPGTCISFSLHGLYI